VTAEFGHVEWLVGELATGRVTTVIPLDQGIWTLTLDDAGTLNGQLPLNDADVAALNLASTAEPGRCFLAAAWINPDGEETILEAGPIWTHDLDADTQILRVGAAGLWSYYDHRKVLPVLSGGQTAATAGFAATGVSLGTIAKQLVELAHTHTGGALPVNLPADEAGVWEKTYPGYELGDVGPRIKEITELEGGPEVAFVPRRSTTDGRYLEWDMQVGTTAAPLLEQGGPDWVWDASVPQSTVSGIGVNVDGTRLGSRAWVPGAGQGEARLIAEAEDSTLTAGGWPLLEVTGDARDSVEDPALLAAYATQLAARSRRPWQTWTLKVNPGSYPPVGGYRPGHWARVIVGAHNYLTSGDYRGRIVQLVGDSAGGVRVQFQPSQGEG